MCYNPRMSENTYYAHDDIAERLNREFHEKTTTNRNAGLESFRSGTVSGFPGYPSSRMEKEYEFKLEYTLPSQREIMERTVEPLIEISASLGIDQYYAYDSELAPHTTLDVRTFTGISEERQLQLTEGLDKSPILAAVAMFLAKKRFSFDGILPTGRDTYIYVSDFTREMDPFYIARLLINAEAEKTVTTNPDGQRSGLLSRFSYMDILHSTVSRIAQNQDNILLLQDYGAKVEEQIGASLKQTPLRVEVDNLYYGSALTYHQSHSSPQLLN